MAEKKPSNYETLKQQAAQIASEELQALVAANTNNTAIEDCMRREFYVDGPPEYNTDGEDCACGHSPIKEVYRIRNRVTGQTMDVGNKCVVHFKSAVANLQAVLRRNAVTSRALLNYLKGTDRINSITHKQLKTATKERPPTWKLRQIVALIRAAFAPRECNCGVERYPCLTKFTVQGGGNLHWRCKQDVCPIEPPVRR